MSKMIPQQSIDTFRHQNNIACDLFGIECELYILNNPDEIADAGLYADPTDHTYDRYSCNVWIEFSPDNKRLRKLGIFAEDTPLPIIARFPTKATVVSEDSDNGSIENIDILIGSYIKIDVQYVPKTYDTDSFEIVDIRLGHIHDAVLSKIFALAPRRI